MDNRPPAVALGPPSRGARAPAWVTARPIAHRGVHDGQSPPENSLAAFELACRAGFGIELDAQLARDGGLVVFHDDTLDRMCGRPGRVGDLDTERLTELRLAGTDQRIPTLDEALACVAGRAPVLVELKPDAPDRRLLVRQAVARLGRYPGPCALLCFDPRLLRLARRFAPGIARCQLAGLPPGLLPRWQEVTLNRLCYDALGRPAFYGYQVDRLDAPAVVRRRRRGVPVVAWTAATPAQLAAARRGADNVMVDGMDLLRAAAAGSAGR